MEYNLEYIKTKILSEGLTLLPSIILDNIEFCLRDVVKNKVYGGFLEAGIWKGGAVIYAYHILKELKSKKTIYAADSFKGMPVPDIEHYPLDREDMHFTLDWLRIDKEEVIKNFNMLGGYNKKQVVFLEGWFKDTLYTPSIKKLSVLRLDGDTYEATWETLDALYPKLSINGYCIIDDYGHDRAKAATDDYREKHNINDDIIKIDPSPGAYPSSYWKKTTKEKS